MNTRPFPGGSAYGGAGTGGGGSAGTSKTFASMIGVKVKRGNVVSAQVGSCNAFPSLLTWDGITPIGLTGGVPLAVGGIGIGLGAIPQLGAGSQILVDGPGVVAGVLLNADVAVVIGEIGVSAAAEVVIDGGTPIPVTGTLTFGGASGCQFLRIPGVRIPAGCHTLSIVLNINGGPTDVEFLSATIFIANGK